MAKNAVKSWKGPILSMTQITMCRDYNALPHQPPWYGEFPAPNSLGWYQTTYTLKGGAVPMTTSNYCTWHTFLQVPSLLHPAQVCSIGMFNPSELSTSDFPKLVLMHFGLTHQIGNSQFSASKRWQNIFSLSDCLVQMQI